MRRMPRIFTGLLGLLGLLGVQCAQTTSAPADSVRTCVGDRPGTPCFVTRIMCLGDSNTQGGGPLASFRYPLWFDLQASERLVDFVGTNFVILGENGTTNPSLVDFPEYYTSFDRDHEGYSGFRTDEVLPLVAPVVASQTPDVCVIWLGTNDVGQKGAVGTRDGLLNLDQILREVRGQAPATMFLIATLPPIGPGSWYIANGDFVPVFNSGLASLMPDWSTPQSPAVLVDLYAILDVTTDIRSDGLHLNESGQEKVAQALHDAIIATLDGSLLPPSWTPTNVQEPSFETLGLLDQEHSTLPLMDWVYPNQPNLVVGSFNPGVDSYQGGAATPMGAEGDEVLAMENLGGSPVLGWVYQVLPSTLEAGRSYSLEVAVGQRLPGNSRGTTDYGGYELQLLAGNRIIASAKNQVTPMPGTFATDRLEVATDDLDAPPLGSPISVRMRLTWMDANSATDFDWVRLEVQ